MSTIAKAFTAVGTGNAIKVPPGKSITYAVTGSFTADWAIDRLDGAGGIEATIATGSGTQAAVTVVNDTKMPQQYRARCSDYDSGTLTVTIADVADLIDKVDNRDGVEIFAILEDGIRSLLATLTTAVITTLTATTATITNLTINGFAFNDVSNLNSTEDVATSGTPEAVDITVYETLVTSGGTQGAESLTIGDGTGAKIGQRKLIYLETLTDPSDSVALDDTNFSQGADTITAIAFDAADEYLLAEWQGASWEIIAAASGVVSVA